MIIAIIQARMGSTRLPGKCMIKVNDKPLLGHLLQRIDQSKVLERVVVATSVDANNDELVEYVTSLGFGVYRGSESDVLERFLLAARKYDAKTIIRINADCPLMDYKVIDEVVGYYLEHDFDYVSNVYPRTYPDGMDVEVFSLSVLEEVADKATKNSDREHVTSFIRESGEFSLGALTRSENLAKERWTLDYPEDLKVIEHVFQVLGRNGKYFDMNDILDYKKKNLDIFSHNEHLIVE